MLLNALAASFRKERLYQGLFHLGLFFFCFYGLGDYPLLDNNEGLYSAIAQSMARSGNWVIPHLNGVPYLEKPPLLYGLMALVFKVFGFSAWSARLVPACAAYALVWHVSLFCQKHTRQPAGLIGLMMASSLGVWVWARMVFFDMLLTYTLSASVMFFYDHYVRPTEKRALGLSWFCLGMAILTKGFVAGVLWAWVVGSFLLIQRSSWQQWASFFKPSGMGLLIVILMPWHLLACLQDPSFAFFYFINEHVLRFLDLREPKDYYTGPWHYHLPRIVLMTWPWLALWGYGVMRVLQHFQKKQAFRLTPLQVFSCCWVGMILLFFSLSRAKANYYMLAGLPAVFILAHASQISLKKTWITGHALIWLLQTFLVGGLFFKALRPQDVDLVLSPQALLVPWVLITMLLFLTLCPPVSRTFPALIPYRALVASGLFVMGLIPQLKTHHALYSSVHVMPYLPQDRSCFLFQDFEDVSSLAFYHPHPWVIIDSHSRDLWHAQTQGHTSAFITSETFQKRQETDWVVLKTALMDVFLKQCRRPAHVIYQTHRLTVCRVEPILP